MSSEEDFERRLKQAENRIFTWKSAAIILGCALLFYWLVQNGYIHGWGH